MLIIPVFDLLGGKLVHAVAGQRENYKAWQSDLLPQGIDPPLFCRTLTERGFRTFYVADLDAIMNTGNNMDIIREMAAVPGIIIWADIGISSLEECGMLPLSANIKWILASEYIPSLHLLKECVEKLGKENTLFSIDLKEGKLLSSSPALSKLSPLELAGSVLELGIRECLVLELARVGTGRGPGRELVTLLCRQFPEAAFYPGGGVRGMQDIILLKRQGAAGVLVASALYKGIIPLDYAEYEQAPAD